MQEKINPALTHPFPNPPAPGSALQVKQGVYWCRLPIPFELNHINVWLLEDGDGYTLVDTGIKSSRTCEAWEQIFSEVMNGKPIKQVIVTHFHPDHFGLARWLVDKFKASYQTSEETQERTGFLLDSTDPENVHTRMSYYQEHDIDDVDFFENFLKGNMYAQVVSGNLKVDNLLSEGDTIEIGGNSWQVIMTYGHAPGHINLYCDALGLLISGDQILPTITSNVSVLPDQPEANPLDEYLESFKKFGALPDTTIVLPSHGLVFEGIHVRIEEILSHHYEMLDKVHGICEQAHSANQLVPLLFRRKLEGINTVLAFGETMANLSYLCYQGKLQRSIESGTYIYQH